MVHLNEQAPFHSFATWHCLSSMAAQNALYPDMSSSSSMTQVLCRCALNDRLHTSSIAPSSKTTLTCGCLPRRAFGTNHARIILYSITGCVEGLLSVVIIPGVHTLAYLVPPMNPHTWPIIRVVRAIRRPECRRTAAGEDSVLARNSRHVPVHQVWRSAC